MSDNETTIHFAPPTQFDFSNVSEWPKWVRRFERYRSASLLIKKSETVQIDTLVYNMGPEAEEIFSTFTFTPETDSAKYDKVREKFDYYFNGKTNVVYERAKFNKRVQEEGEPVERFITSLHTLAKPCNYGALKDELIRDRIIVGIRDYRLSESLQADADITLDKVILKVRQSEKVHSQQKELHSSAGIQVDQVKTIYKGGNFRKANYPRPKQDWKATDTKPGVHGAGCSWCAGPRQHPRKSCPANNQICKSCKGKGHFAIACFKANTVSQVSQGEKLWTENSIGPTISEGDSGGTRDVFLGSISGDGSESTKWQVNVQVGGLPISFKIDTGAEVSAIPLPYYSEERHGPLLMPLRRLYGASNQTITTVGMVRVDLQVKEHRARNQLLYVCRDLRQPLLGQPAISALRLVARVDEIRSPEKEFPELFVGLGCIKGDPYRIELKPDAVPYAISVPRRVPLPLVERAKTEIDRMLQLGVITRVEEPTDWCAGVVFVIKKDGSIRVCVDLTKLNESVKRERHMLPTVEQTLGQLSGAKVFSKLDANSGFWQLELAPESSKLTTFLLPFGRFKFERLPFGITSAPEVFQKRMLQILEGLEGVVCHMDDILVFGRNQAEHDSRLQGVLERLKKARVTLNSKCEFSKRTIRFLGHIVDSQGIRPDEAKIEAIMKMPRPEGVADIRRLLGMVNHLGEFIPNLAELTLPIRDLLKQKNSWIWDQPHKEAHKKIKKSLSSTPVLALYDPNCETAVSADASCAGIGATLTQKQGNGDWKPVAYASRSLTETETRYAQIEKEALASTWAMERFSDYVTGKQIVLYTDHKPLVAVLQSKHLSDLSQRLQRFRMRLMRYR